VIDESRCVIHRSSVLELKKEDRKRDNIKYHAAGQVSILINLAATRRPKE